MVKVSIDTIQIVDRKRSLLDIDSLAQSIKQIGLLNPITIQPDGRLIAGYHRFEACKSLGWTEIDATVCDLGTLESELAEIDENLIRSELHWIDRDKQLARRKVIYETLYPATMHGGDRKGTITQVAKSNPNYSDLITSFTQDVANKTGLSRDTIEHSVKRAASFTAEQCEILKSAAVPQTDATRLARLEEPDRIAVIDALAKREIKREEVKARIAQLKAGGVDLPLQKTDHDVRVKSVALTTLLSSESNEWYTPASYVDAARELMGGIDVDPASCELANLRVRANKYYTKEDNGLAQSWAGRVWLNPPYGLEGGASIWTRELIARYESGLVTEAVLLVNANTEAKWFQPLYEYLICFTNHRIRFYNASGESSQPTQGNALIYLGKQEQRYIELFRAFGSVVRKAG